ncbi:MAG: hypothetical protein J1F67_05000 [Muribaculaceae bacterium]|nr:hypothetical protein [Muribaculaceae bacterium]
MEIHSWKIFHTASRIASWLDYHNPGIIYVSTVKEEFPDYTVSALEILQNLGFISVDNGCVVVKEDKSLKEASFICKDEASRLKPSVFSKTLDVLFKLAAVGGLVISIISLCKS